MAWDGGKRSGEVKQKMFRVGCDRFHQASASLSTVVRHDDNGVAVWLLFLCTSGFVPEDMLGHPVGRVRCVGRRADGGRPMDSSSQQDVNEV